MKKIYVLTSFFFTLNQAQSQTPYSLTQANSEPVVGDTYMTNSIDTTLALPMAIYGANVLWNVTGVSPSGTVNTNTFTSAAGNADSGDYPGTNLVQSDGTLNTFFKTSLNQLELLGLDAGLFVLNYSTNSATVLNYPVSFGSSSTDATVGGTMNVPMYSLSGTFTGSASTIANATGTLSINGMTDFTDCIRIKTTQHLNFSLLFGSETGTIDQSIYNFYNSSSKFPLFTVSYTHVVASGIQSIDQMDVRVTALPQVVLGVKDLNTKAIEMSLFPNPSTATDMYLNFAVKETGSYEVEIINTLGSLVKTMSLNTLVPGSYQEKIDVSGLTAGLYTVKITGGHSQGTRKLMIQ